VYSRYAFPKIFDLSIEPGDFFDVINDAINRYRLYVSWLFLF
jgi:hypothetical protein